MNDRIRRDVLKGAAAAGVVGLPTAGHAAAYDPSARFELVVSEVELRRNAAGRMLMARIYQPKGAGLFPTVLDLHGGAWNRKNRFAEEPEAKAQHATRCEFAEAMERLFRTNKMHAVSYGSPSRGWTRIERK